MKFENRFLIVIIGAVALYAIFLIMSDFNKVYEKFSDFQFEYLPIILSLVFTSWFVIFLRWNLLLRFSGIRIPIRQNFLIYLTSFALTILPGKVGELIKSQLLKNKFGIARKTTVPIILVEQFYTVIGITAVSFLGIWFFELGAYIIIISAILLIGVFVLISSKSIFNKFLITTNKIKFLSRFTAQLPDSYDIIKKATRGKIFVYASFLSSAFWLIEALEVYFVLLSFGIEHLEFLNMITTYTASIILGVASFLPLGIGVVEGSLTGFLVLQGIDVSVALTLVVVVRIFTRWISVSVGFIAIKLVGGLSEKN